MGNSPWSSVRVSESVEDSRRHIERPMAARRAEIGNSSDGRLARLGICDRDALAAVAVALRCVHGDLIGTTDVREFSDARTTK
jgi:hypothetical protein